MTRNYWSRLLQARQSRRRLLVATGCLTATAAFLAACGGDGDEGEGQASTSDLLTEVKDTLSDARKGGVRQDYVTQDVQWFDDFLISAPVPYHFNKVYNTVIGRKPTQYEAWDLQVDGSELAESWEMSPDKLTLVLKVRKNARLDPRPPTNGRPVDAQDFQFTWGKWEAMASKRADLSHNINPAAPITSMTATDQNTVTVKMATPQAAILNNLTGRGAGISVFPREADGGYDTRRDMRGSGPFMLTEYQPSARFRYERNPGYWDADKVYMEGVATTIIPEYAAGLAQFKTGNIYSFNVRGEDLLQTKQDVPAISLYKAVSPLTPSGRLFYGFEGGREKSPFVDERVRQAFSLSQDRDLWIDTFFNVPQFKGAGLPVETRWNTAMPASWDGYWLDPRSREFGQSAKYYEHNIDEAKKLLSAAGFQNGVDLASHHIVTANYGADFPSMIETMLGMAQEAGFRIRIEPTDFNTSWRPLAESKGKFDGIAFINVTPPEPTTWALSVFNRDGAAFTGFSADSSTPGAGDPRLDDLTVKLNQEFDQEESYKLMHELQRYEAQKQYSTMFPGGASVFQMAWPAIANWNVLNGARVPELSMWIDATKRPIAS
jgi:ABC-type transport system substrate-binding protein